METDNIIQNTPFDNISTKESIKLAKNSRGFNWEIKINAEKDKLDFPDLERLKDINNKIVIYAGMLNDEEREKKAEARKKHFKAKNKYEELREGRDEKYNIEV